MKNAILVLNAGSASLKFHVFEKGSFKSVQQGGIEQVDDFEKALKEVLRNIQNISAIEVVGHRVVHGNSFFKGGVRITDENLPRLKELDVLAPLHNPWNRKGIELTREYLPQLLHVAVFDTAFFADIPRVAREYALAKKWSEQYGIVRYGFHGTSHKSMLYKVAEKLKKDIKEITLISCHLGGGASIAAIKKGKVIDMSMGYTPLEGLVMTTRTGDIDAGAVLKMVRIARDEGLENDPVAYIDRVLNHESGWSAISGGITDFRELLKERQLGNADAQYAFDLFVYRIQKYIGAYVAVLGNVDAIVFTGSIGSGHADTREAILNPLKNTLLKGVKDFAMPTAEEEFIARETVEIVGL